MDILVREPINEQAINKITHDVFAFYKWLSKDLEQEDPSKVIKQLSYGLPKSLKSVAKGVFNEQEYKRLDLYYKLAGKFKKDPPNIKDVRILSQAVYFLRNKTFGEGAYMMIASTDHHFSKIREKKELNDFVPVRIYNELGVYCDWPDEILKILKCEVSLPEKKV